MSRRARLALLIVLGCAAAAPGSAAAAPGLLQPSATTAAAPPPPPPPPAAQSGRASIDLHGGLSTRRLRYVYRGQRVLVTGIVRPYVAGQRILVEVLRRGRVVSRQRVSIRQGSRGRGVFSARVRTHRRGFLRIRARHRATAQQKAFSSRGRRIQVVRWHAGAGSRGTKVVLLQRALLSLGFAVPVTGFYNDGTSRAVLAFRKTNGMARTGFAGAAVYSLVFRHRGRFKLRFPGAGRHVEFDWSRQVLALAKNGRAWRVYHASSGKPSTPTVFGTYRFYSKTPGTNSEGMVNSNYFIGGYAIHGYHSVPAFAASHGCIRIPIPNSRQVYDWIPLGMRIFVYH
jgi:L,D-transpeptidase catalytic domain/Putative peptidoglycan binding domain